MSCFGPSSGMQNRAPCQRTRTTYVKYGCAIDVSTISTWHACSPRRRARGHSRWLSGNHICALRRRGRRRRVGDFLSSCIGLDPYEEQRIVDCVVVCQHASILFQSAPEVFGLLLTQNDLFMKLVRQLTFGRLAREPTFCNVSLWVKVARRLQIPGLPIRFACLFRLLRSIHNVLHYDMMTWSEAQLVSDGFTRAGKEVADPDEQRLGMGGHVCNIGVEQIVAEESVFVGTRHGLHEEFLIQSRKECLESALSVLHHAP